jgi:hypothetical protein
LEEALAKEPLAMWVGRRPISTSSSWLAAALESKNNLLDGKTIMAIAAIITAGASRANNHIYLVPVIKKFSVLPFDKSYKDFVVTHP